MSGNNDNTERLIKGVFTAPNDVIQGAAGGTLRGTTIGSACVREPLNRYINNPNNNVVLRATAATVAGATTVVGGAVGGTIGAVTGTVQGVNNGVTRIVESIFD